MSRFRFYFANFGVLPGEPNGPTAGAYKPQNGRSSDGGSGRDNWFLPLVSQCACPFHSGRAKRTTGRIGPYNLNSRRRGRPLSRLLGTASGSENYGSSA